MSDRTNTAVKDTPLGMRIGTVLSFSDEKGFGWIRLESGDDAFVHFSAIASTKKRRSLQRDQHVRCEVWRGEKGLYVSSVTVTR